MTRCCSILLRRCSIRASIPIQIPVRTPIRSSAPSNVPGRMIIPIINERLTIPIHIFTTFLITFSAVVTVLETVPAFHSISGSVWFGLETTLVVLFTIEYIGRCIAHGTSWKRFFNWVICECLASTLISAQPFSPRQRSLES